MSLTHPIGDMITRIRNAQSVGKETVKMPYSSLKESVLNVLKNEGFINGFKKIDAGTNKFDLVVELKYVDGNGAIQEISIVSKPGLRAYSDVKGMPHVMNGLGVAIMSTPHGVMTDAEARTKNVGGEVLCKVI